jgi:hypothetical protein
MKLEDAFAYAIELRPVVDALRLLRSKLSTEYCYHSEGHTLDVINESLRFGKADKLPENDLKLIVIAAAWHDTGFVIGRDEHELQGVKLFTEYCKESRKHDLKPSDIETISQLIKDTKLLNTEDGVKQIPSSSLSRYLLDADLSNLGRKDFFCCLDRLCEENQVQCYDFYRQTLDFIARHTWHTQAANRIRRQQQIRNIAELTRRIFNERYSFSCAVHAREASINGQVTFLEYDNVRDRCALNCPAKIGGCLARVMSPWQTLQLFHNKSLHTPPVVDSE